MALFNGEVFRILSLFNNICYERIKDKNIYLYEKSSNIILELIENNPNLLYCIKAIIDSYASKRESSIHIGRVDIPIVSEDIINSIDLSNSIIVITSDYYQEAYKRLQKITGVENLDIIYYYLNKENYIEQNYLAKYKNYPLKNIIIFRSGPHASSYVQGMDFADNARAVFEYMLSNKLNNKYKLVWIVKNPKEFSSYADCENVEFISWDWAYGEDREKQEIYFNRLFLAKYVFFTDAYGFARNCRKNQVRVQLWHGCGFKTRVNFVPCEHRYEYNIVIGDEYKKIHANIYGLRNDQVLITGYPKADWLFHLISEERLLRLGIPKSGKYIFWLPTFRNAKKQLSQLNENTLSSDNGMPILNNIVKLAKLNDILNKANIVMIIKLHPFQSMESIHLDNLSNIVLLTNEKLVKEDVQINQLLGWADALVSDYSSVAVDYLILDRPIAFTMDDVEEYSASRGFVFDNIHDWLPGKELYSAEDFYEFIKEIAVNDDSAREKRKVIRKKMHTYYDDKSSERLLNILGIV